MLALSQAFPISCWIQADDCCADRLSTLWFRKARENHTDTREPHLWLSRAHAEDHLSTARDNTQILELGYGAPEEKLQLYMPQAVDVGAKSPAFHQAIRFMLYKLSNNLVSYKAHKAILDLFELCIAPGSKVELMQAIGNPKACVTSKMIVEELFKLSVRYRRIALIKICLRLGANPNNLVRGTGRWVLAVLKTNGPCHDGPCLFEKEIFNLFLEYDACVTESTMILCLERFPDRDWMMEYVIQNESLFNVQFDYRLTVPDRTLYYYHSKKKIALWVRMTPFTLAILSEVSGKTRLLELFLARTATPDLDAMITAAYVGDLGTISLLHEHGYPVDGLNDNEISPLMAAVLGQNKECVLFVCDLLLSLGANPFFDPTHPRYGYIPSALHLHCTKSSAESAVLHLLVGYGSDMNYRARTSSWRGQCWGQGTGFESNAPVETPLEYAIYHGNIDIANYLLSQGCNLTGRELSITMSRRTGMAIGTYWYDLVHTLSRDLSQFQARTNNGLTLLQEAISTGNTRGVDFLLSMDVHPYPGDFWHVFDVFDEMSVARRLPCSCPLSPESQIRLVHALPNLVCPHKAVTGLEVLALRACKEALRVAFSLYTDVYDSGALQAVVLRTVCCDASELDVGDVQELVKRRPNTRIDLRKENAAIAIAAAAHRFDIIEMLTRPGTNPAVNVAEFSSSVMRHMMHHRSVYFESLISMQDWSVSEWISRWYYIRNGNFRVESSPLTIAVLGHKASWHLITETVEHLLSRGYYPDGWTYLVAIRLQNLALMRHFQRLGFDITRHDNRPDWCPTGLQLAIYNEDSEMVTLLLEAGAVLDERETPASEPYHLGLGDPFWKSMPPGTAIQQAVQYGNLDLITLLINLGAIVNAPAARDSGATALQIASIKGYLPLARFLIEKGADINAPAAQLNGRTALQGAAEQGRLDMVVFLLLSGALTEQEHREPFIKAVVYAEREGFHTISNILREHRRWSSEDHELYDRVRDQPDSEYHEDEEYNEEQDDVEQDDMQRMIRNEETHRAPQPDDDGFATVGLEGELGVAAGSMEDSQTRANLQPDSKTMYTEMVWEDGQNSMPWEAQWVHPWVTDLERNAWDTS